MSMFSHKKKSEYRSSTWQNISAQKGFSLIELIIVITIMAVLVGLIAPAFSKVAENKRKQTCRENRMAILNIYARCVYDTSVLDVQNNATDFQKIFPDSADAGSDYGITYKPVVNEVKNYISVPNTSEHKTCNMTIGVDADSHTAWIACPDCGTVSAPEKVTIDLTGWNAGATPPSSTDAPIATPEPPTPSPAPSPETCFVTFSINGHGSFTDTNPQEVEKGKNAIKPIDPTAPTFNFKGWYEEASGITYYDFTKPVEHDMTLYAKWEGMGEPSFWPYPDDEEWWTPELFAAKHKGDVYNYNLDGTYNNMYLSLKAPSGIFTSRAGNQFVLVRVNDNGRPMYMNEVETPELYAATHMDNRELIQLTGMEYEIDITGLGAGDKVRIPDRSIGDLITFVDGGTRYKYVFWHSDMENASTTAGAIRAYPNHPSNMYRIE